MEEVDVPVPTALVGPEGAVPGRTPGPEADFGLATLAEAGRAPEAEPGRGAPVLGAEGAAGAGTGEDLTSEENETPLGVVEPVPRPMLVVGAAPGVAAAAEIRVVVPDIPGAEGTPTWNPLIPGLEGTPGVKLELKLVVPIFVGTEGAVWKPPVPIPPIEELGAPPPVIAARLATTD